MIITNELGRVLLGCLRASNVNPHIKVCFGMTDEQVAALQTDLEDQINWEQESGVHYDEKLVDVICRYVENNVSMYSGGVWDTMRRSIMSPRKLAEFEQTRDQVEVFCGICNTKINPNEIMSINRSGTATCYACQVPYSVKDAQGNKNITIQRQLHDMVTGIRAKQAKVDEAERIAQQVATTDAEIPAPPDLAIRLRGIDFNEVAMQDLNRLWRTAAVENPHVIPPPVFRRPR